MQIVEFYPCQGLVASIIAMMWLPNSYSGIPQKVKTNEGRGVPTCQSRDMP